MKWYKILLIILIITLLNGCTKKCKTEDGIVCYNRSDEQYAQEESASLNIAVPSAELGRLIVEEWAKEHPDNPYAINFAVIEEGSVQDLLSKEYIDVYYIDSKQVPFLLNEILPFHTTIEKNYKKTSISKFAYELNYEDMYFLPIDYDGLLFAYNKTMLEQLGVDLTDEDNDFLPDSIDSWEELFLLADQYAVNPPLYNENTVSYLFPFAFNELWSFYSFLTAGEFKMFPNYNALEPGFDSELFLNSLQFIYEAGSHTWNYQDEKYTSDQFVWKWEEVIEKQLAPFTLIGDWMYYEHYQQDQGYELVFSRMPSYKEHVLEPLVEVNGFIINAKTDTPSLANEFIRMMSSMQGKQVLANASEIVPVLPIDEIVRSEEEEGIIVRDENRLQMIYAYFNSVTEPMSALPDNTSIRGFDVYYEVDWMSIIKDVFDHKITPEQAQTKIVELVDVWLNTNNPVKEDEGNVSE